MANREVAVSMRDITKTFGTTVANNKVNLDIYKGEILSLLGENGSGKTTLMNMLSGIYYPDEGEISIYGKPAAIHSPKEAFDYGIGMIHQHFKLVDVFTAAENIVLGLKEEGKLDLEKASMKIREICDAYGFDIDPKQKIYNMSVSQKQTVEIVKVLYRGADILILDEPTAVLTPQETEELFAVIRRIVKEKQMTVIIITHKLYEVMNISDRVGVMRRGKLVGVEETKNVDERILASIMVGREVLFDHIEKTGQPGEVMIKAEDLYVSDNRGLLAVNGVSLEVKAGEVLGVAAIEGNGQSELVEALTGMRPLQKGSFYIHGTRADGMNPGQIRELGAAHIPEDRVSTGVSLQSTITENMIIGKEKLPAFSKYKLHLKQSSIARYARELSEKFDLRGGGVNTKVGDLSGGNMQKVVVAREFSFDTPVLIIAQPTRGVDIGAIEFIHKQIIDKRNQGCAILLVSADLDEIFRLSDRIITMFEGKVTGEFKSGEIDKMEISYYMTGHRETEGGENDN